MSDILMKEMESVSLSPATKEESAAEEGVSSFLLVDEQENLQVKFVRVGGP